MIFLHRLLSQIPFFDKMVWKGTIWYIFFLEYLFRRKLGKLNRYEINTDKARFFHDHVLGKIQDPEIRGIEHGYKAFKGPTYVVIDMTNRCYNSCIGCWIHSPLVGVKHSDPQVAQFELAEGDLAALLQDLREMGTRIIRFTGGGEPLLHPAFARSVALAKEAGMRVAVTTSLPKVKNAIVDALLKVDELAVSLWAADKQMYGKMHPNQSEDHFDFLLETIHHIQENRTQSLPNSDQVQHQEFTFCNVLTNENYQTVDRMIEMARICNVDKVYFTLVDPVDGKADALLLDEDQRQWLHDYFSQLDRSQLENVNIDNFEGFLQRLKDPKGGHKGHYDAHLIDEIPCYMGWHFSRILANGDVVPCCRAVKKVMGNIGNTSFKEIWTSARQNEFRNNGLRLSKFHPYFREIACYKTCDNLAQNRDVHERRMKIIHENTTVS